MENKDNLKIILDDSLNLSLNQIRDLLSKMTPSEIAHALESSPPRQRDLLFSILKNQIYPMFFQRIKIYYIIFC